MKYILLIHDDEQAWGRLGEAERRKIFGEYGQFTQELKAGGHYLAGAQLHPTSTATSVRVRDGKRLVTDGPFAETRGATISWRPPASTTRSASPREFRRRAWGPSR